MRLTEVERKYDVPSAFRLPDLIAGADGDLADATVGEPITHRLTATYYDTANLGLAQHGVALRYRTGGTDAGWHLKRPAGADRRTEIHAPRRPGRVQVPADFDDELAALRRGRNLEPVVRLTTRRIERALLAADGTRLAVVVDDRVTVRSPDGTIPPSSWRELEVELADGPESVLDEVEGVLLAAGAEPAAAASKLARALGSALPPKPRYPRAWRPVADYARAQRDVIIALDPAIRRNEPEAVHDVRVAARRLRSTLRTFRPLLPADRTEPLRDELRWLASELGPMRDHEVIAERLTAAVDAEPAELIVGPVKQRLAERFGAEAGPARQAALASLDSDRYFALLDRLDEVLDQPPVREPLTSELRRLVRKTVVRTERQLAAADQPAPAVAELPAEIEGADHDTAVHEARKSAKRARYAAEALRPVAGRRAARLADRLKQVQDVLGAHQDTVVARQVLQEEGIRAHEAGDSAFTYGLLHARQREAAAGTLARLSAARRKVRKAAKRWLG